MGSPPPDGSKKVVPKLRSVSSIVIAPASTGRDEQQQERRHQHRPGEERHLVQRHAGRAHVEDGGDEVDRAEDRGRARKVERQDAEIERRARMARGRERRIDRPAAAEAERARSAFDEKGA